MEGFLFLKGEDALFFRLIIEFMCLFSLVFNFTSNFFERRSIAVQKTTQQRL